jgi:hypothetical protein
MWNYTEVQNILSPFLSLTAQGSHLLPKNLRKLCVCERKCPETQVRGRIANHTEYEFNRLYGLMDYNFTEVVLLVVAISFAVVCHRQFCGSVIDELFL